MNGEAWSCFAQLPSGLIDRSATLTLNWLRPRPTHAGFKLTPAEVDDERHARNVRLQRAALITLGALIAGVAVLVAAVAAFEPEFSNDETVSFVAIWASVAAVSAAALTVVLTALAIMQYRRAEPKRQAFGAASVEFEQIDAWRSARCDAAFWDNGVDEATFERECAELLGGYFRTGQVMLTRAANDYGVDVLICSPQGRIVAQCKPWVSQVGAAQVRALAGSKAFFGADRAVLMTIVGPTEDGDQARDVAAQLQLELWDVTRIVAVASQLRQIT